MYENDCYFVCVLCCCVSLLPEKEQALYQVRYKLFVSLLSLLITTMRKMYVPIYKMHAIAIHPSIHQDAFYKSKHHHPKLSNKHTTKN